MSSMSITGQIIKWGIIKKKNNDVTETQKIYDIKRRYFNPYTFPSSQPPLKSNKSRHRRRNASGYQKPDTKLNAAT